MGGRGGSSGLAAKEKGFQYTMNGKTVTVQKTATGQILVNGAVNRIVNYEKLLAGAKEKQGFKKLTDKDIKQRRKDRSAEYSSHDYEMGIETGFSNKNNRRAARTSRLASRVSKKKR